MADRTAMIGLPVSVLFSLIPVHPGVFLSVVVVSDEDILGKAGALAQCLLDADQLVVFGDAIGA
ncbi:hypothetical protein DESC_480072 [Desulfosarcina cetonica]|nr:hypothetical protein DESC_480072 [Desulfosarcina cetonica]